jgi:hypothetical protein
MVKTFITFRSHHGCVISIFTASRVCFYLLAFVVLARGGRDGKRSKHGWQQTEPKEIKTELQAKGRNSDWTTEKMKLWPH